MCSLGMCSTSATSPHQGMNGGRIGYVLVSFYFILFGKESVKFDSWVHNFNFPCIPEEIRKYELTREVDLFN